MQQLEQESSLSNSMVTTASTTDTSNSNLSNMRTHFAVMHRRLQRPNPTPIEYLEPNDLIEYCLRKMANLTRKEASKKSREELLEELYDVRHMFHALADALHEQITLHPPPPSQKDLKEEEEEENGKIQMGRLYTVEDLRKLDEIRNAQFEKKLRIAEKKAVENPKSTKSSFETLKTITTTEVNSASEAERLRTLEIEAGKIQRAELMKERMKGPDPEVLMAREAERMRKLAEKARRMEKIYADAETMIFDRPGLSHYKKKDELQTLALALDLPNPLDGTVAEIHQKIADHLQEYAEELEEDPRFSSLIGANRYKKRRVYLLPRM